MVLYEKYHPKACKNPLSLRKVFGWEVEKMEVSIPSIP